MRQAGALIIFLHRYCQRIEIDRQISFCLDNGQWIFESGNDVAIGKSKQVGEGVDKTFRVRKHKLFAAFLPRDQRRITPYRFAVAAPVHAQRPPRQRFTGVPLTLAIEHQTFRGMLRLEAPGQCFGKLPFLFRQYGGVPFRTVHIVDRYEGRLAALGQPHVLRFQLRIDVLAERFDCRPLRFGIRFGYTRVFMDSGYGHGDVQYCLADVDGA